MFVNLFSLKFCPVSLAGLVLTLSIACQDQSTGGSNTGATHLSQPDIQPPESRRRIRLEVVSFDELLARQIKFHQQDAIYLAETVKSHVNAQKDDPEGKNGGKTFALGFVDENVREGLRTITIAPVNGGRIEPGESTTTDLVTFFDDQERLLAFGFSGTGEDWSYHCAKGVVVKHTAPGAAPAGKHPRLLHSIIRLK